MRDIGLCGFERKVLADIYDGIDMTQGAALSAAIEFLGNSGHIDKTTCRLTDKGIIEAREISRERFFTSQLLS
jgi:hypothetical protein